jgi:hypothetical protein
MDLDELRKLAGINEFSGYTPYVLDENPSETAAKIKQKERDLGVKPGDPEWFQLWFTLPHMTGALNQKPGFRGRKRK